MCFYRIILITALAFYTISGNSQSLQHEVKVNSVILKLHEKSGFYSNNAFFDENNHSYVRTTGHPKLGGFIEEYDLFTGQLKHLWHVGESPDLGAFVKLNDFQYWVFNQTNRQLLLIDSGKIVKKYQESDYQEKSIFITYFADCQFNNIILHENNIYVISNLLAAIRFTPPVTQEMFGSFIRKIDLRRGAISAVASVLPSTKTHDYGFLNRHSTFKKNNKVIIAPFYSEEIYYLDLKTGALGSYNNKALDIGLLFDKYRNCYYRIMITKTEGLDISASIILLDANFNKSGQYNLPKEYRIEGMFITSSGLHILNHSKYQEDRTRLHFDCFTFKTSSK